MNGPPSPPGAEDPDPSEPKPTRVSTSSHGTKRPCLAKPRLAMRGPVPPCHATPRHGPLQSDRATPASEGGNPGPVGPPRSRRALPRFPSEDGRGPRREGFTAAAAVSSVTSSTSNRP